MLEVYAYNAGKGDCIRLRFTGMHNIFVTIQSRKPCTMDNAVPRYKEMQASKEEMP